MSQPPTQYLDDSSSEEDIATFVRQASQDDAHHTPRNNTGLETNPTIVESDNDSNKNEDVKGRGPTPSSDGSCSEGTTAFATSRDAVVEIADVMESTSDSDEPDVERSSDSDSNDSNCSKTVAANSDRDSNLRNTENTDSDSESSTEYGEQESDTPGAKSTVATVVRDIHARHAAGHMAEDSDGSGDASDGTNNEDAAQSSSTASVEGGVKSADKARCGAVPVSTGEGKASLPRAQSTDGNALREDTRRSTSQRKTASIAKHTPKQHVTDTALASASPRKRKQEKSKRVKSTEASAQSSKTTLAEAFAAGAGNAEASSNETKGGQRQFFINDSFQQSIKHLNGDIPQIGTVTAFSFFDTLGGDSTIENAESSSNTVETSAQNQSSAASASTQDASPANSSASTSRANGGFAFFGAAGIAVAFIVYTHRAHGLWCSCYCILLLTTVCRTQNSCFCLSIH